MSEIILHGMQERKDMIHGEARAGSLSFLLPCLPPDDYYLWESSVPSPHGCAEMQALFYRHAEFISASHVFDLINSFNFNAFLIAKPP